MRAWESNGALIFGLTVCYCSQFPPNGAPILLPAAPRAPLPGAALALAAGAPLAGVPLTAGAPLAGVPLVAGAPLAGVPLVAAAPPLAGVPLAGYAVLFYDPPLLSAVDFKTLVIFFVALLFYGLLRTGIGAGFD